MYSPQTYRKNIRRSFSWGYQSLFDIFPFRLCRNPLQKFSFGRYKLEFNLTWFTYKSIYNFIHFINVSSRLIQTFKAIWYSLLHIEPTWWINAVFFSLNLRIGDVVLYMLIRHEPPHNWLASPLHGVLHSKIFVGIKLESSFPHRQWSPFCKPKNSNSLLRIFLSATVKIKKI